MGYYLLIDIFIFIKWLQSYYEIANEEYGPEAKDPLKRGIMRQGVCLKGEIVYIPSGWWHRKYIVYFDFIMAPQF